MGADGAVDSFLLFYLCLGIHQNLVLLFNLFTSTFCAIVDRSILVIVKELTLSEKLTRTVWYKMTL